MPTNSPTHYTMPACPSITWHRPRYEIDAGLCVIGAYRCDSASVCDSGDRRFKERNETPFPFSWVVWVHLTSQESAIPETNGLGRLRPNLYFIGGQWVAREARIAAGLTARNRYFFSKWNDLTKRSSLRHKAYKRFFARLAQARAHFDTKERALPRSLATSTWGSDGRPRPFQANQRCL